MARHRIDPTMQSKRKPLGHNLFLYNSVLPGQTKENLEKRRAELEGKGANKLLNAIVQIH